MVVSTFERQLHGKRARQNGLEMTVKLEAK
jgi:hypothetical protein